MTNLTKQVLQKELSTIIHMAILFCLFVCSLLFGAKAYANQVSSELKDQVMRFHVLANSDTTEDQLLKENVRDAVISYIEPKLKEANSIEESREIVLANLETIGQIAVQICNNWGKEYKITVEIADVDFPTKTYGDITFPAGTYEACRILIGEAKGENWWCVLYPPLCFVDVATGVVPLEGKDTLKENLTSSQYEVVAYQSEQPYKVKFKLLSWVK
ncbi:MAG: stage II sporulation protein R [Epulopiscium sp. Nele67-Bin005]|nr:MAG: stage II sporulation protein R [Epulopiscium sp. Nele67-Bin005]